jgi:SAM-dependent methyltransferase
MKKNQFVLVCDVMKINTITYDPEEEDKARSSWYLSERDRFVLRIIKKFTDLKSSKKILDAGCGTGGVISGLQNTGILKVGNDMSLESLSLGKKRGRIFHCVQASNTHLPFRDKIFDITTSSEVLEHVEDDLFALKEIGRVTKHRIILTVPAHKYLWTDSDDILLHKRRYSKSELLELFKKADMCIVRLKPYGIIPAILVVVYKLFIGNKPKNIKTFEELPLGSRFKIPRLIDVMLKNIFSLDLWLSEKGLIIWGHSWWACIEHNNDTDVDLSTK